MKIETDREGGNLLLKICDAALRSAGVNSLNDVNIVLNEVRKSEISQQQIPDDSGKVNSVVRSNRDGKPGADSVGTGPKT